MKKVLKITLSAVLIITMFTTLFFIWASSPTLPETDYKKVTVNDFKQAANTDNDSIYSIVTYNIGYLSGMTNNLAIEKPKTLFDNNLQKVIEEFKTVNPDIIAFQEIDYNAKRSYHINQQNEIAALGYNYTAKAVNWDKTYLPFPYWPPTMHFGKMLSGQSILSKYPLNHHKRIILDRVENTPFYRDAFYLDRLAQIATVKIENKELVLINVHLEAFDQPTRAQQLEKVIELFEKYSKTNPTILLGDFNSAPKYNNAVINELINSSSIGNAAFKPNDYEMTFNSKTPNKRIDYIFYTKNSIEYIDGKVLNQFGQASDHLPVEMRFKLK